MSSRHKSTWQKGKGKTWVPLTMGQPEAVNVLKLRAKRTRSSATRDGVPSELRMGKPPEKALVKTSGVLYAICITYSNEK